MLPQKKGVILLCVIIGLLFTSCGGNGHNVASSSRNSGSAVSSSSTASSSQAQAVPRLQQAAPVEEKDYTQIFGALKVDQFTAKTDGGVMWFPLKITDTGEIFGFTAARNGRLSDIVECDLSTHKSKTIYTIKDGYQPQLFEANGHYLMWTEYLPPSVSGDSRVVLYDRGAKTAVTLSDRPADYSQLSSDTIALGDDFALWSSGYIQPDGKANYKISKYDYSTKQTTLFRDTATWPAIGSDFVAWFAPENNALKNSAVFVQNLKDNSINQLTVGQMPMYIAAHGDALVYSGYVDTSSLDVKNKDLQTSQLVLYKNKKLTILEKSDKHLYEFPQITQNYISWDENGKRRVYCMDKNRIADFPEQYGSVNISDKYFFWDTDTIKNESPEQAQKDGMYMADLHVVKVGD